MSQPIMPEWMIEELERLRLEQEQHKEWRVYIEPALPEDPPEEEQPDFNLNFAL